MQWTHRIPTLPGVICCEIPPIAARSATSADVAENSSSWDRMRQTRGDRCSGSIGE